MVTAGRPAWNLADLLEAVAGRVPDAPAVVDRDRSIVPWREVDRRADQIAAALLTGGLARQATVGVFMLNSSAFLEAYYGSFKAGLVPVNVNYRYGPAETKYLLDDSGAAAVLYHARFRDTLGAVRSLEPERRRLWIEVPDGTPGAVPDWAEDYTAVVAGDAPRADPARRHDDDILLLYTGGTTGLPKGVVWRQAELFEVLVGAGNPFRGIPVPESIDQLVAAIRTPGPVDMAACPYMHATGLFNQFLTMMAGGTSVVVPATSFDPETLFDTASRERVTLMVIVGDAMARPLAEALRDQPGRWDLSALRTIVSSGATFSRTVKELLFEHLPDIAILDAFGSSEASGVGATVSRRGAIPDTADFTLGANTRLLDDDGRLLPHGTEGEGLVALGGRLPVGYHNDPAKTAATFRTIDGARYAVPGDRARVDASGRLHLLGRGSSCVNSGGEKIYPEEVDEVIRRHPAVADAACVGVPDPRFGQAVAAVVQLRPGHTLGLDELRGHVKGLLAGYKAPRHLVTVDTLVRSPAGKLDHRWLADVARAATATD